MDDEPLQERLMRFEKAASAIILHDPSESFGKLLESRHKLFQGFKLAYSTNNTESKFSLTSLQDIEKQCPVLKKFFYGSGLIFFTTDLFHQTMLNEIVEIPIDYSLSLDSNAAEKFRIWENGGSLDKEQFRFEQLIRFLKDGGKERDSKEFNFDYSFFIIENLENSRTPENHRPFNTIRALKRFDHLIYDKNSFDVLDPLFEVDRASAGLEAIEALYAFQSSHEIQNLIDRRNGMYLILLKAILLKGKSTKNLKDNLNSLIAFCLDTLGAYGKTEIYFAWKFLKYGEQFKFFDPINQLSKKSLRRIRGMAWDLYSIRYQEVLATRPRFGDFYIPFFASFDNRFIEFAKACPIRALLRDNQNERIMTIFLDEKEYTEDLNAALTQNLHEQLRNPVAKLKRISNKASRQSISTELFKLESEFEAKYR